MRDIFKGNEVSKEIGDLLMSPPEVAAPIILNAVTIYGRCRFSKFKHFWRIWYSILGKPIP